MSSIIAIQTLVTLVIATLELETGKEFGDHALPNADLPYGSVWNIAGGQYSGPFFSMPEADASVPLQVDSVGLRPEQARWLSDQVRVALLGRNASGSFITSLNAPDGWEVIDRRPLSGLPGIQPGGSGKDRVFTVSERFMLELTRL